MAAPLEFWFEFASTYSYVAAMRVDSVAARAGVAVVYRPFLLGPIFAKQGWNDSPFNIYEAKGRYMWRDMERLCRKFELPFRKPTVFPRNGLLAARVALSATGEPWQPAFVRGVYAANFAEDSEIGEPEVVRKILEGLGLDGSSIIARAGTPENKDRLKAQTAEAVELGIFGAPSFVTRGELYWGGDRLEDAMERAREVR